MTPVMRFVVSTGTAWTGLHLYGPFDDAQTASRWAEETLAHDEWHVVPLVEAKS